MNDDILCIEELSMNAHPSLETQLYDGWALRFSGGYTKRANSVNPLYAGALPLDEKIAFCERMYARQGLPTVFKMTPASPEGLDELLERNGYEVVAPTNVMTRPLTGTDVADTLVTVRDEIDACWQHSFFALNGVEDTAQVTTASAMLGHILQNVLCARIEQEGGIVACGLCVVERGYAGLYDIVIDPICRKQGYGYRLCSALLGSAHKLGARSAYLQVVAENAPARALYAKLGFVYLYQYWYRVKS